MKKIFLLIIFMLMTSIAHAITLTWDPQQNPQNPATSFKMYRQDNCTGPFNLMSTMPFSTVIYTDNSNLVPGTRYCYQVTAANTGGESTASNVVIFQVPTPIAAPTNLRGANN